MNETVTTHLGTIGIVPFRLRQPDNWPDPPMLLHLIHTCAGLAVQNEVLAVATKSHNDLCGVLTAELSKLKGSSSTADARLTTLANWMEEQVCLGTLTKHLLSLS